MIFTRNTGRGAWPKAPPEIATEVELYARESGRTATVHYIPYGGWFARFSLRCNDKRMLLYQQGMAPEPPTEDVWFHLPKPGGRPGDFVQLDILQMGASGVRQFLERGNTWSGRGEYASIEDATRKAAQSNADARAKYRADLKEASRYEQRDKRRQRFKIPFLRVGISFNNKEQT